MTRSSFRMIEKDSYYTIVYAIAAPTLLVWALVSFVPLFNVAAAWGSLWLVLGHIAFFGAGAIGLLATIVSANWMQASPRGDEWQFFRPIDKTERVRRIGLVTMYALTWMTAYGFFVAVTL
jgi:hypothetical protein